MVTSQKHCSSHAFTHCPDIRLAFFLYVAAGCIKEKGYTNIRAVGKSMGGTMLLTRNHPDVSRMVLWAPVVGIAETAGNLDDKLDTAFSEVHSLNEITLDEKT